MTDRMVGTAFLGLGLILLAGCSTSRVMLSCEDVVSLPKHTAVVRVKLEQRSIFFKDIEDQKLEFTVLRAPAGVTPAQTRLTIDNGGITDEEGEATARLYLPRPGLYEVRVWYRGSDRYLPRGDRIIILAVEPEKPVLVLDVDNTLTNLNWLHFNPQPEPYDKDTVRVVNELSQRYAIVYLSARPRPLHKWTQEWLARHGFPEGPILLWFPERLSWLRPVHYKRDELLEMKRQGINLVAGVSNTTGDIKAYRRAGMVPIILGKKLGFAESVRDWAEIGAVLMAQLPALQPDSSR